MFSPNTSNAALKSHGKHDLFLTKTQSTTKIWIIGIVMFFALCVTIISIAICVGGLVKDKNNTLEFLQMNNENSYIREQYVEENKILDKPKKTDNIFVLKSKIINNLNQTQDMESNVNDLNKTQSRTDFKIINNQLSNETTDDGEAVSNFNFKKVVFKVMGSLADAAVDGIKSNSIHFYPKNSDEDLHSIETTAKKIIINNKESTLDNGTNTFHMTHLTNTKMNKNVNKSQNNLQTEKKLTYDTHLTPNPDQSVNYLYRALNIHNKMFEILNDTHNTQISSPDDVMGTVTTNLDLLKEYVAKDNIEARLIPDDKNKKNLPDMTKKGDVLENNLEIENVVKFKDLPLHLSGFLDRFDFEINDKSDTLYDQNDYFYSDTDAQSFYYDYERHTWTNYILDKIQEVYNWITTDFEEDAKGTSSKGNESATLPQILQALNYTLLKGDLSILLLKIKSLYDVENDIEFNPERSKRIITNTSSVVSFGLLAIDIILLRNLQLMAWEDQKTPKHIMLNDPEVFALNSIFMDPAEVKEIYERAQMKKPNTKSNNGRDSRLIQVVSNQNDEFKKVEDLLSKVNLGLEFGSFISSTIRAGIHLGRAFQNARSNMVDIKLDYKTQSHGIFKILTNARENNIKDSTKSSELDCLWILYCKNLDKATKLDGPYGFLAKLNSVGLRLILGELPLNKIIETLVEETITESKEINCSKLFPRCNEKNVAKIVLENVLTNAPNYNIHKQTYVP